MATTQNRTIGAPAPAEVREPIAALIAALGVREVARRTGLSREQATAIASGANVVAGTVALAREGLRRADGDKAVA